MEHVRIDEGVKRGPRTKRNRTKPSDLERKARDEAGQFLTRYSPELRKAAIDDCKLALECGGRIEDIADKHKVPRSTMYSWLIGEQDAGRLRTQFFDGQCARALNEIRVAADPLDLTRADKELNGWLKVAAVRDPANYGPKNFVTIENIGDLGDKLRRARERVIDVAPQQVEDAQIVQAVALPALSTGQNGEIA